MKEKIPETSRKKEHSKREIQGKEFQRIKKTKRIKNGILLKENELGTEVRIRQKNTEEEKNSRV